MPNLRRTTTIRAPIVVDPTQQFEGDDGAWSTFTVLIGTPPQEFRVLISTASSETWVVSPEGCTSSDPTNCPSDRGAQVFNGETSLGFEPNSSSTWTEAGLYSLDLETDLGYSGNGLYGEDVVGVSGGNTSGSGGVALGGQVVAGIAAKDYFFGMLGLSDRPTSFSSSGKPSNSFIANLFYDKLIPSFSYGYTAGAQYAGKGIYGNLILGGYDQSRFKPTSFSFSFAASDAKPLQVGVQSITGSNTLLGVNSFTTSGGHLSFIDSTVPEIWLPQTVADNFATALGLTYDENTDRYLINDTMHTQLKSLNPQITFILGNTAYNNGNNTNLVLPYAAFDQQIGWPIYNTTQNYFPIRRAANDSQYTIGRVFLQETYLVVDYQRQNFTIGQALFSDTMPAADIVTIHPLGSSSSSGISTGAIAGIAAGGALLLAIAGFLFWFLRKRRRANHLGTAELDSKESNGRKNDDPKYDEIVGGAAELSAPHIQHRAELENTLVGRSNGYTKLRPQSSISELPSAHASVSELPTPAPVFEMPGDHGYLSAGRASQRSSRAPSFQRSSRPSPISAPSYEGTNVTPLSLGDTWHQQPSPRSPR